MAVVDTTALTQAVTDAEGVAASVVAFIQNVGASIQKAVADALAVDDAADQGSIDAANAAIKAEVDRIVAVKTQLAAAITA